MKIIFSGGGTLGPVIPLLEIARVAKNHNPKTECLWIGTKNGPERAVVEAAGLGFLMIGAGKWRRYLSFWNFIDIFKIIIAFFQSIFLLIHERPDLLVSAGGFVSVPLHYAAGMLGIPTWVHQQDITPGLANRLMVPIAKKVTTALQETAAKFPVRKTEWIGNPSRELHFSDRAAARRQFGIPPDAEAVIFALGGGTGSSIINQMIIEGLSGWPHSWHVLHLTGKERPGELSERASNTFPNYHVYKFFTTEMAAAYAAADIVIARAGFVTLTELAALAKPAVIVPMSGTHQEENARFFASRHGVATLREETEGGLKLVQITKNLMQHPAERQALGDRLHNLLPRASEEKIYNIICTLTGAL